MYIETAKALKGSARRGCMAQVMNSLGNGGQWQAEEAFGGTRATIRKGQHELACGLVCLPGYGGRSRKRAEVHFPHLLADIKAIADGQSQTDARFESSQLYTRLSATQVRQQIIDHKRYSTAEVPSQETIRVKLNELGYRLCTVKKYVPQKNKRDRRYFCAV